MKSQKLPASSLFVHRHCDSGAALVIALSCIVILSGLVLAFLTFSLLQTQVSTASAGQTSAGLFARGAVDSVISELKQEITAGSVATYSPSDVRDPNCFFLPTTNQAMVPYRMDPGAPANVIKRSASNIAFYPVGPIYTNSWPAPIWAANFSTTNPGTLGRAVSLARWNKALLMPTLNPASTDVTPVSTFIPPDWIYMTRTAGPVTTWSTALGSNTGLNTNYVVGRYAYVVYDEGGLLDVNAAGYPTSVTLAMVRNKISEACADLTQTGLNANDVNTLVNWRNPSNAATSTLYTNYVYTPNTNAFLTPATGERIFTSRQQLIDFLTQSVATNNPPDVERVQAALPLLTHFSRELNAPSWYPETNVASPNVTGPGSTTIVFTPYPYYSNSTNNPPSASTATIFVPLARATSSFTNTANLTIQTNQAVAFSRFPLSRLAWLGTNGPANGATAAQVQQSFGLKWDSANYAWQYVGPTGSTIQSTVSTLSQISQANPAREPNFFELLKAGILTGSVNIAPTRIGGVLPSFSQVDSRYGVPDQQIMQIGLSTIDQASSALLPTRIEFGANTTTTATSDFSGALYGNKNLPYLYKMIFSPYRPITMPLDGTNTQQYFTAWEEPVFWNPYQNVITNTAPLQIRLRADGTNNGTAGQMGGQTVAANAALSGSPPSVVPVYEACHPEIPCGPGGGSTDVGGANGASIELDSANAATFSSLATNPIMLSSLLPNGFTPIFNDVRAQSSSPAASPWPWPGQVNADIYTDTVSGVTYAGFWLGMALAPDPPDPNHEWVYTTNGPTATPSLFQQGLFYAGSSGHRATQQFVLEANYGTTSSPTWLEIERMRNQYSSGAAVEENDTFTSLQRHLNFFTIDDPRTGRFAFEHMQPITYNASGANSAVTTTDISAVTWTTYEASTNNYFTGRFVRNYLTNTPSITFPYEPLAPPGAPAAFDEFRLADNSATTYGTTSPAYLDTDGVQRPGDGWWSSTTANVNTLPMREDTPQDRPVILNRPFYSVGELGYVYRDMPWRSLNFSSASSPDAGLLDFFSVNDGYGGMTNAPVVAGVLDLNTRNPQVLQAMLNGAARAQLYPANDVSATDATNMANTITNYTSVNSLVSSGPLLNKSEIATRLTPADPTVVTNPSTQVQIDTQIKERRETIARALASAGQVRTWNLMIDVIAQTGHVPPTASGFDSFVVTAEQRYWAHVAIDRYTGQVISIQLEPVSE